MDWNEVYDMMFDVIEEAQQLDPTDGNAGEALAAKYASLFTASSRNRSSSSRTESDGDP